ncbi:MAG TPA: hypothetical protein VFI96_08970 [Longimicrobiaceae bacterium]|nr:hypothetical protein [Longimicrobiaceae bacterium]
MAQSIDGQIIEDAGERYLAALETVPPFVRRVASRLTGEQANGAEIVAQEIEHWINTQRQETDR